MGKVKSAIITAFLVAAIAVLAFFALFSWPLPNGVEKYNSFISSIHLGKDITGEAVSVIYPEGVISEAYYEINKPEIPEDAEGEEKAEYEKELNSYVEKYFRRGGLYIEKEVLDKYYEEYGNENGDKEFKNSIAADAEVISGRLGEKGYSKYSVSVQDGYTIRISVPTNFTYAQYKASRTNRSDNDETYAVRRALQYATYNGTLSLRNSEVGSTQYNNILTDIKDDVTTYFKSVSQYAVAGNYAVKIVLTGDGEEAFKKMSNRVLEASSEQAISFYVGETQLLSLNVSEEITEGSFYISVDKAYAQDYSIILRSVANNEVVVNDYDSANIEVVFAGAELGDYAAVCLGVALLLIFIAAAVYSIVRYRLLGLVNLMSISVYSLALIVALLLINIQLTFAGAVFAVLGLALLCACNFAAFEAVRKETGKGKTIYSAVKSGYKGVWKGILETHVILLVAAIMLALIGVGELAACGLIFIIATLASFVLHWFTRFMWYVISSPVKDKFRFAGYKREEDEDDE